jgi:hypothetical protein
MWRRFAPPASILRLLRLPRVYGASGAGARIGETLYMTLDRGRGRRGRTGST